MYNQFHTEQAVYVMNLAIRQLEELDEMNSHMSGNGKTPFWNVTVALLQANPTIRSTLLPLQKCSTFR